MSRREFDVTSNSKVDGEEEEATHDSAESRDGDELENDEEMTGRKKKLAKLARKEFVEVERWDRMKMSDTDILAHIREMVKLEQFPLEQTVGAVPAR